MLSSFVHCLNALAPIVVILSGKETSVSFPDCNYLLIWTKPGAPYVCIEPWAGFPAYCDEGYDITQKEGMNKVESGARYINTHTIYF